MILFFKILENNFNINDKDKNLIKKYLNTNNNIFIDNHDITLDHNMNLIFQFNPLYINKINFLHKIIYIVGNSLILFLIAYSMEDETICKYFIENKFSNIKMLFKKKFTKKEVKKAINNCMSNPLKYDILSVDINLLTVSCNRINLTIPQQKKLNKIFGSEERRINLLKTVNKLKTIRNKIAHHQWNITDTNYTNIFNDCIIILEYIFSINDLKSFNQFRYKSLLLLIEGYKIKKLYINYTKYIERNYYLLNLNKKEKKKIVEKTISFLTNELKNPKKFDIISNYIINNITSKILDKNINKISFSKRTKLNLDKELLLKIFNKNYNLKDLTVIYVIIHMYYKLKNKEIDTKDKIINIIKKYL